MKCRALRFPLMFNSQYYLISC